MALGSVTLGLVAACGAAGASEPQMASGQNASATGSYLFEQECATCHGKRGEGTGDAPAILGSSLDGGRFKTGQGLYEFVARKMPKDNPGELEIGQYWHIVTFMVGTTDTEVPDGRLSESNADEVELAD